MDRGPHGQEDLVPLNRPPNVSHRCDPLARRFQVAPNFEIRRLHIAPDLKKGHTVNTSMTSNQGPVGYELRFRSLFDAGRGYSFPCNASGQVDIDSLSDSSRSNYFFARTVIGREFAIPAVQASDLH